MKKTFTLLFFVGFLTSAFAQSHGHEQHGDQNNDNKYQPSRNYGDNNYNHTESYPGNNGYNKNHQGNNWDNGHEYAHNDNWNRDDMRRDHNPYPEYGNQRRRDDYSYRAHRRRPFFEIIFGRHNRH